MPSYEKLLAANEDIPFEAVKKHPSAGHQLPHAALDYAGLGESQTPDTARRRADTFGQAHETVDGDVHLWGDQLLDHVILDHASSLTGFPARARQEHWCAKVLVPCRRSRGEDYGRLKRLTAVWKTTNAEDAHLVGPGPCGVHCSPGYRPGPYSPSHEACAGTNSRLVRSPDAGKRVNDMTEVEISQIGGARRRRRFSPDRWGTLVCRRLDEKSGHAQFSFPDAAGRQPIEHASGQFHAFRN